MSDINVLPFTIVQKLEETGIPQDSLIFYQNNRWVYQIGQAFVSDNQSRYQSIDSLGPFGIHSVDVTFILFPSTSEYTIIKIGDRQLKEEEKVTGIFSPIAHITLDGFARSIANIPEDATHFCWLYPPYNILNNNVIDLDDSHESNLLRIGGFVYFKVDKNNGDTLQLVRINSLSESATNGLTFEGPYPWKKAFTEQLWNQKRFQPVTLSSLLEKGARYFAFINPYETFFNENNQSSWMPSPHGAFVYLFNEDHSPHLFDCYFSVADDCLGVVPSDEQ